MICLSNTEIMSIRNKLSRIPEFQILDILTINPILILTVEIDQNNNKNCIKKIGL